MLTVGSDTIRPMTATAPMPGLHGREAETGVLGRALAAEDAGRAMGRLDRARGLLDQAAGIYEGLEAARDLARTEATMRQLGIRRGVRGRPQTGWPSLTVTERTVADLVADGLSHPQIGERLYVSRRTVQTHVAHIFMKLGVSSRAQLAAEVIRQPGRG